MHFQDDLAQPIVVEEDVELGLEVARADGFQAADEGNRRAAGDLEGGFALRTEAAVGVSAFRQADDAGRAPGWVGQLELDVHELAGDDAGDFALMRADRDAGGVGIEPPAHTPRGQEDEAQDEEAVAQPFEEHTSRIHQARVPAKGEAPISAIKATEW
jgi:hypothetical protein